MYKLDEGRFFYDLADNQAIVIDAATGVYYAMNPLPSHVFDLLAKGVNPKDVVKELLKVSGCPEDMESRFERFKEELIKKEMLVQIEDNGYEGQAIKFPPDIKEFALEIEEFTDAQEMLLADPVHDVDAQMGWPHVKE